MSDDSKYYPIADEDLALALAWSNGCADAVQTQQDMMDEFRTRLKAVMDAKSAELNMLWDRISSRAGVDPAVSRNPRSGYRLETRYLSSGFAALVYDRPVEDPLTSLLRGHDEPPVDDGSSEPEGGAPKGATLN